MEKVSLPIKTKIAAWWMIIFGAALVVLGILNFRGLLRICDYNYDCVTNWEGALWIALFSLVLLPLVGLFFLWPAIFILKRKKWTWYLAVVILLIGMIILAYSFVETCISYMDIGRWPYYYEPTGDPFTKGKKFYGDPFSGEKVYEPRPQIKSCVIYSADLLFSFIILLPPFILLFLDRKNFWKIAS